MLDMTIKQNLNWNDGKVYKLVWHDCGSFDEIKYRNLQQSYGVCFYNGKLVIGRGDNNKWGLIGGHIEKGETPEEALEREVIEESNMKVLKQIPIGYQEVINPDGTIDYQLRSFCVVEPIGEFVSDPAGSVTEIKLIDPKEYKNYFNWGKIGDRIMKRAIQIYNLNK
jgi:ADP-ribose pyrophosphatase YjhB (NUDIX family)